MSFWKAGIGGMIGFTLGGPIGGIIGAIIGSKLSDNQPRPSNNQQNLWGKKLKVYYNFFQNYLSQIV